MGGKVRVTDRDRCDGGYSDSLTDLDLLDRRSPSAATMLDSTNLAAAIVSIHAALTTLPISAGVVDRGRTVVGALCSSRRPSLGIGRLGVANVQLSVSRGSDDDVVRPYRSYGGGPVE